MATPTSNTAWVEEVLDDLDSGDLIYLSIRDYRNEQLLRSQFVCFDNKNRHIYARNPAGSEIQPTVILPISNILLLAKTEV